MTLLYGPRFLKHKPFQSNEVAKNSYVHSNESYFNFNKVCKLSARGLSHNYFYIFVIYTVDIHRGKGVQSFVHTCPQGREGGQNNGQKVST